MKKLANILTIVGVILFIYTLFARFIGEPSILGLSRFPLLNEGFTAVGMFSAIACILLLAIIALLNSKE